MRRTTLAPAFCFLVFLATRAGSQSSGFNRAQTISNIFQIPIQTLTAISNFVQNTRPIGEIIQRRRNPQIQTSSQFPTTQSYRPVQYNNYQRSRAASIAGLYVASDGSGFKI